MKENITVTLKNIESYLKSNRKSPWGMHCGSNLGAISIIFTKDRTYFEVITVDDKISKLFIDIYMQCVCEKPYLNAVHTFVNMQTSKFKSGRIDIDDVSGTVKVRIESQILSHPAEPEDIESMEELAIFISDRIEKKLDKLCHGVIVTSDDPDAMDIIERRGQTAKGRIDDDEDDDSPDELDFSLDDLFGDDEDDTDDEDEDDELDKLFKKLSEEADKDSAEPDISEEDSDIRTDPPSDDEVKEANKHLPIFLMGLKADISTDALDELIKALAEITKRDTEYILERLNPAHRMPWRISTVATYDEANRISDRLSQLGAIITID